MSWGVKGGCFQDIRNLARGKTEELKACLKLRAGFLTKKS